MSQIVDRRFLADLQSDMAEETRRDSSAQAWAFMRGIDFEAVVHALMGTEETAATRSDPVLATMLVAFKLGYEARAKQETPKGNL